MVYYLVLIGFLFVPVKMIWKMGRGERAVVAFCSSMQFIILKQICSTCKEEKNIIAFMNCNSFDDFLNFSY